MRRMPSDISAHLYQEEDSKAVAAGRIGDLLVRKQVLEKRSSDEDRKQRFSRYVKNIQVRDRLGTSNYLLVVTSMEKMIQVGGRCLTILMIFLVLFVGLVMGFPTKQHNKLHNGVSLEVGTFIFLIIFIYKDLSNSVQCVPNVTSEM